MAWEEHCNINQQKKYYTFNNLYLILATNAHSDGDGCCKKSLGHSCTTQIIMWICREGWPSHALMSQTADAGGLMYQEVVYQKVWII